MRRFELIDGEGRELRPSAIISYDEATGAYGARVEDWAEPGDVPAIFAAFVAEGNGTYRANGFRLGSMSGSLLQAVRISVRSSGLMG